MIAGEIDQELEEVCVGYGKVAELVVTPDLVLEIINICSTAEGLPVITDDSHQQDEAVKDTDIRISDLITMLTDIAVEHGDLKVPVGEIEYVHAAEGLPAFLFIDHDGDFLTERYRRLEYAKATFVTA